ncbi:hypothetical protein SUGI_0539550 [Cryptomeria japonica]|nr:hypothetical protein SUGI_0539550 [Cryptomeria japonica]
MRVEERWQIKEQVKYKKCRLEYTSAFNQNSVTGKRAFLMIYNLLIRPSELLYTTMATVSFCIKMMIIFHFHFLVVNACRNDERSYFLDYKAGLDDFSGRLSSWKQLNYCQWEGVLCDHHSGHFVSLDLKNRNYLDVFLTGVIHPSLFNLQYLQHLDLSGNKFTGTAISPQLAKLQRLTQYSLQNVELIQGSIPVWIGELSELRILSLAFNEFQRSFLPELLTLGNLQILDLSHNNLSGPIPRSFRKLTDMVDQSQSGEIEMTDPEQYTYGVVPYFD